MTEKTTLTEIQRIARFLNMDYQTEDNSLCVKIQSKIKSYIDENKKLKFTNTLMNQQLKDKRNQVETSEKKMSDFKYVDEVKKVFDTAYSILKTENEELNETIVQQKQLIDYYEKIIKDSKKGKVS